MHDKLYIPKTLKVGYNERSDTYTGKLAYVTYIDDKGVLRKEKSWKGWIQEKMGIDDFENKPTEGFVINKDIGGTRHSYGWNARIEKVRVYDPRNFEIEVSIPNLLFILAENNSIKGKGLEGTFVYAWSGAELILLPTDCKEYKESMGFTALQSKKISTKTLVVGATYITKKQEQVVYLGKYPWYETAHEDIESETTRDRYGYSRRYSDTSYRYSKKSSEKRFIFARLSEYGTSIERKTEISHLAAIANETPPDNYAELFELFSKSKHASPMIAIKTVPVDADYFTIKEDDPRLKSYYKGWGYSEEYQFVYAMNHDKLFAPQSDGSFIMFEFSEYKEIVDVPGQGSYNRGYIHKGFQLRPIGHYWFKEGKLYHRGLRYSLTELPRNEYKNGKYIGRGNTLEYREDVMVQKSDLAQYGFVRIFAVLESGEEIEVKNF